MPGRLGREQYIARNTDWNVDVGGTVVGEIYCRGGSGAGHYTLSGSLAFDYAFNCSYGSSRDSCPSAYGCNELAVRVLCCAPTPSCGNGIIDNAEEQCDDGNQAEDDGCLNSCALRYPGC